MGIFIKDGREVLNMKKKYMEPEVEKILFTFERIMLDPNDPEVGSIYDPGISDPPESIPEIDPWG